MRVRFWGTRGSVPSPGPGTVRYGGNTACLEVRSARGGLIVLDAGTGIRELGRSLTTRSNGTPVRGAICLSHAHWDHIQGLPFFAPAFRNGNHFTVWGAGSVGASVAAAVRGQMSPVVFPVSFDEMGATFEFRELDEPVVVIEGCEVRAFAVRHPGGALGYRIRDERAAADAGALVYIPDNEIQTDVTAGHDDWHARLVAFTHGARVLVHDSMYTDDEYTEHRGWGHSTYRDAVELALAAQVETLVLFHHNPDRSDDDLDEHVRACRAHAADASGRLRVLAAAEGLELEV